MIYLFNANGFFLCTEICLLTGKYENVCLLTVAMNLMCNEPDFAITSTEGKKNSFYLGVLPQDSFAIWQ